MKKILFLLSFILCFGALTGQSVYRTINAGGMQTKHISDDVNASQVSLNNAYFGSAFSYQISGDQNFEENFLFDASLLYNIEFEGTDWNFPIAGNFQLPAAGGNFEEFEVGVYPWSVISNPESSTVVVIHGGAAYLVDPEVDTEISPQTFRILAGGEVSLPLANNDLPVTLSVTPLYEINNLGVDNNFGIESTFIFPISPNLAVMGEWYRPIDSIKTSTINVGVLVNGAIGQ